MTLFCPWKWNEGNRRFSLGFQAVGAVKFIAETAAETVAPAISLTKLRKQGKYRNDESISAPAE